MLDAKIYGLCLERIKHQILIAQNRGEKKVLLETYCTRDTGEVVDILELYDLTDQTDEGVWEKLSELAFSVSVLLGHTLEFGHGPDGEIGLFVIFSSDADASSVVTHSAGSNEDQALNLYERIL